MSIKDEIKQKALELGMDLCGVASVDRFAESPEGRHPCDILPGCKSVIVVGVRLLDGIVQVNFHTFEDGRRDLKGLYGTYGYAFLPNFELTYACTGYRSLLSGKPEPLRRPARRDR
jgi:epoxyqueuosine reductase QueG